MRQDGALIKDICKIYGEQTSMVFQGFPFFYISKEVEEQFTSVSNLNEQGFKRQIPEFIVDLLDFEVIDELMPFPSFCIMDQEIGWHYIEWQGDGVWRLCLSIHGERKTSMLPLGALFVFTLRYDTRSTGKPNTHSVNIESSLLRKEGHGILPGMNKKTQDKLYIMLEDDEFNQGIVDKMTRNLLYFLSFFKWAQTKHMVEVQKVADKRDLKTVSKGKKPWLRGDLPSYIYLDSPKVVRPDSGVSGGEGSTKRGHYRRATFRTLRNPKYKNHPKYLQPNAVPVRAAWVGSKEWTVGNTVYTVRGDSNVSDRPPNGHINVDEKRANLCGNG